MKNRLFVCHKIPSYYYFLLILLTVFEDTKKVEIQEEKMLGAVKLYIEELTNSDMPELAQTTYKYSDLESELTKFLKQYQKFVHLDGDKICLNPNIDYNDLKEELSSIEEKEGIDSFFFELRILRKRPIIKNYLGVNKIRAFYRELIKNEAIIEDLYMEDDNSQQLPTLLKFRNETYKKLAQSGLRLIEALEDEEPKNEFDYEEDYPIDFFLYSRSKYIEEAEKLDEVSLDTNLLSSYQVAIFGLISMAEVRLRNDLTMLHLDVDNSDIEGAELVEYYEQDFLKGNYERIYATPFDSDLIFYLTYIKKLDVLMEIYGVNQELERVKNRLIYALDDASLELFDEKKREEVLAKKIQSPDIDPEFDDGYHHFSLESYFFIQDIFEGNRGSFSDILKKLAFVATYYDLTKDETIKDELKKYTSENHYLEYYRFITKQVDCKTLRK